MTIVAEKYDHVIGVDTHVRTHTYAVVDAKTGALTTGGTFPTTGPGIARALEWIARQTQGEILVAVEGTGSYGASLTRALTAADITVCEVKPPKRKARTARGKSDQIDALAAARTILPTDITMLSRPRAEGLRAGLRILLAARRSMNTGRTADRNALNALVRSTALGIDARKALTDKQIIQIAAWLQRDTDDIAMTIARDEARRLATAVIRADKELKANHATLARLVTELCSNLQDLTGVGPVTGATVLAAYSHHGRVRSEAAFAALAGVNPIPASSGNTVRHRLNRRGDRQLNEALDIIARVRISCDAETRVYVDKRTNEGKTSREIRRSLKRYIARQIYRTLHATA